MPHNASRPQSSAKPDTTASRRAFLAAGTAAVVGAAGSQTGYAAPKVPSIFDTPGPDYRIENDRIHQSVFSWCFDPMPVKDLIHACHKMGIKAMDVPEEYYPLLKKLGMKPAMTSGGDYREGPTDPEQHEKVIADLKHGIDAAAKWGAGKVLAFTGMRQPGLTDKQLADNCVRCWKKVIRYAEEKNVVICLEILNTRDDSHPMKGHPGYFGDDVELCVDLIRRVDSPNFQLLFDIYHVQVMNGDVISRIRQYKDIIGHYHVAGAPGRNEPDETQEIFYPAIMRAILETGYEGYVSQEFIPTWEDKLAALRKAVKICDV